MPKIDSPETLSLRTALDLLRGRLMTSLAPSQAHSLRGLLNGVVLSGEVVRLSATGKRDEASAAAAGSSLLSSTARFREAFEIFLKHLVNPESDNASCESGRALHDAAALVAPLAQKRKITVEASSCPPGFPVCLPSGAMVTVLAYAAVEVMKDVADGGRVVLEATMLSPGATIVVSGRPSTNHLASSESLPLALDDAVAAFGGSRTAVTGQGFSFSIPASNR